MTEAVVEQALAVDVGGTKLAVGRVTADGRLVERRSTPTPRTTSAGALWGELGRLVAALAPFDRFSVVGVGCGGPMTPGGALVSPLNIGAWRDFPLAERLAELTGLPTRVDNDAKALALGEAWVGAAVGERNFLAMVVSTGVGGGIVLDGRLLEGAAGNAGHIGHVLVDPGGHELPGHAPGTLEVEASGTGIAAHTGRPPAEASTATIVRTGTLVGRAVGSAANLLDLRLAVVAGSVALGFGEPFFAAAQAEVDRLCVLEFSRGTRVVPAGLGDEGPLVGAAAVGWRHLGRPVGILH
jgi:glucokinase